MQANNDVVRFPDPHPWQLGTLTKNYADNLDDGDDDKDDTEYGENMVKKSHICTAKLGFSLMMKTNRYCDLPDCPWHEPRPNCNMHRGRYDQLF